MTLFGRLGALAAFAWPSWAQCSMCRTAAAAQGPAAARALNAAVLILFVPAVTLFCGVFLLAFLRRDPEDTEDDTRGRS